MFARGLQGKIRFVAVSLVVGSTVLTRPVGADQKLECIQTHERGQQLKREGKLRGARNELVGCTDSKCPEAIRAECTELVAALVAIQPSIVIGARDAQGKEQVEVAVLVDGLRVAERLEGKPLELDPGEHSLRLEPKSGVAVTETLVVRQGEKNRLVMITLRSAGAATAQSAQVVQKEQGGIPASAYLLGGLGVLGIVGFSYLALSGLSKESDLEACKPKCPSEDVSEVRTRYTLADISLGVGVVALGAATWLLLSNPTRPSTGPKIEGGVSSKGGFVGLRGTF